MGIILESGSAKGDVIFLLNPDTWIEEPAISRLLQRLISDENIDIIGPQLFFPDGRNQSYYLPKTYLNLWRLFCDQFYLHRLLKRSRIFNSYFRTYMNYSMESEVEQVSGAALMMRRSVLDKIGILDEDYFKLFTNAAFQIQQNRLFRCNAFITLLKYISKKILTLYNMK
jgi:GT2 family glycosyltransferase